MKIIRWILFLPVALLVFAVAQLITGAIAGKFAWFWGIPLVFFLGGLVAVGSCSAIRVAPNSKVGATIGITLFLLFETMTLLTSISHFSAAEVVIRLYT